MYGLLGFEGAVKRSLLRRDSSKSKSFLRLPFNGAVGSSLKPESQVEIAVSG